MCWLILLHANCVNEFISIAGLSLVNIEFSTVVRR